MPRHRLDKPLPVYGAFTLEHRKLTFRTSDAALLQRLQTDCTVGRVSTVCLLGANPYREFTGLLESVAHLKVEGPQQWEVVMVEQRAKPRKQV